MKNRAITFFSLVVVAFVPSVFGAPGDTSYSSYAFGKRYISTISRHDLDTTPQWTRDENPPLSARKAMKLADARREELVKDDDNYQWHRKSAAMIFERGESVCYWQIHYQAQVKRGGSSGPGHHLDLYILMDGTLIEPEVSDTKK